MKGIMVVILVALLIGCEQEVRQSYLRQCSDPANYSIVQSPTSAQWRVRFPAPAHRWWGDGDWDDRMFATRTEAENRRNRLAETAKELYQEEIEWR